MNPGPRRQLHILTSFLASMAAVTALAVILGPVTPAAKLPGPGPDPLAPVTTGGGDEPGAGLAEERLIDVVGRSVGFVTTPNGTGSGVLIADDLVVTNAHVVWPFDAVFVRFPGGRPLLVEVVGVDARTDIALLQLDRQMRDVIAIGDPDRLDRGAALFTVGYPGAIELAPHPIASAGTYEGIFEWEFSGVRWLAASTAAVSGQSGGALVDGEGRLVGLTTFGSSARVFAVAVDDLIAVAEEISLSSGNIAQRRPPRGEGATDVEVDLGGPWDQATYLVWLPPASRTRIEGPREVSWRALDPFGLELAGAAGVIDVAWPIASPGIIHGSATAMAQGAVGSSVPLVALRDPDDGNAIELGGGFTGFVDVPGDRDWLTLELDEAVDLQVTVEAQTRMRVALYDARTNDLRGEILNQRGFFFDEPPLVIEGLAAGTYVVVVEDIGAQFGIYRVDVE